MKKLIVAAVGSLLLLTGCLFPEKFSSNVTFSENGSYTVDFDGTVANVFYLIDKAKGATASKNEEQVRQEFEKMAKTQGVTNVKYLGDGRAAVKLAKQVTSGQETDLFGMIKIGRDRQGQYYAATPAFDANSRKMLKDLTLRVDGSLSVKLPKNAEVINHNADSTPGIFSSSYSWKIQAVEKRPTILFKLK